MSKNLFSAKDIKKLVNLYKQFITVTPQKNLSKLRKLNPTLYKKFKFPVFPERGLSEILEVALAATLKREEGRFHRFSIAVAPLVDGVYRFEIQSNPFIFAHPLDFNVENINKLSTALDGTDNNIKVVFDENGSPQIIGFTDAWENALIIESLDLGKLLFSVYFLVKSTLALIENRKIRFFGSLDENNSYDKCFSSLYKSSLFDEYEYGNATQAVMGDYHFVMKEMHKHGHGGALFFVSNKNWVKSVQEPVVFSPTVRYCEISRWAVKRSEYWDKFEGNKEAPIENKFADKHVDKKLKLLSQMTALDGATIVTNNFEILAFGAKLKPINSRKRPDEVITIEPFEDSIEKTIKFENIGGTRHQSAAQFIFDQRDAVAVIASQDGKISVMFWDKEIEKVRVSQHLEYSYIL